MRTLAISFGSSVVPIDTLPGNDTVELFPFVILVAVEVPMASILTLEPPVIVLPLNVSDAKAIETFPARTPMTMELLMVEIILLMN